MKRADIPTLRRPVWLISIAVAMSSMPVVANAQSARFTIIDARNGLIPDVREAYANALGAKAVIEDDIQVENMRKFGELIGMAFQIKDDLFDYSEEAIGKPTGIDIKEQKMTLPLIHVLNTCTPQEKKWLINSIKNHNKDKKRVKEVIAFVKNNNGLAYAENKMVEFQQEALALLQNFEDSEFKDALTLMVNYVIERKK